MNANLHYNLRFVIKNRMVLVIHVVVVKYQVLRYFTIWLQICCHVVLFVYRKVVKKIVHVVQAIRFEVLFVRFTNTVFI